ncbi:hypothetical protein C2845_PM10G07870 [Panicum miliaceum]|uniref:Uncharacterized protein n=1 Tax=Panicum miliaceum TaxID=4540 RepID=A0A3L6PHB4_PANMI|nr:hypothetical protein C2845_PM10G07870 [Panicum miliaceum]
MAESSSQWLIEDVITKYINLPEHDRGGYVRAHEYLIKMLTQLKCESDIAEQLIPNKGPVNSNIEELQHEIRKYQHQVQALEERLRFFYYKSFPAISLLQTNAWLISSQHYTSRNL